MEMPEELEEYIEKFRAINYWTRFLGYLAIILILGYMDYSEKAAIIDQEHQAALTQQMALKADYDKKKNMLENIGKMEDQLKFTTEQLAEARKKLPDKFKLDRELKKITRAAAKSNVILKSFKPGVPVEKPGAGFKFAEMPIDLEVTGGFHQVARFYDTLAHFETLVDLRNIDLDLTFKAENSNNDGARNLIRGQADGPDPRAKRLSAQLNAKNKYFIYRSGSVDQPAPGVPGAAETQPAVGPPG